MKPKLFQTPRDLHNIDSPLKEGLTASSRVNNTNEDIPFILSFPSRT